ncbi:unnamed protein product [Moneuplotes crassus]|uniref:Uncharacterized protein n=1 Tax=Euplotes crassus TaxID=5936 RepID=A0AAD1UR47_EUPCR|nr:unnamed protein product [Moneuplotes crassus]
MERKIREKLKSGCIVKENVLKISESEVFKELAKQTSLRVESMNTSSLEKKDESIIKKRPTKVTKPKKSICAINRKGHLIDNLKVEASGMLSPNPRLQPDSASKKSKLWSKVKQVRMNSLRRPRKSKNHSKPKNKTFENLEEENIHKKMKYFYGPYDSRRCENFGLLKDFESNMKFEDSPDNTGAWKNLGDCILDSKEQLYYRIIRFLKKKNKRVIRHNKTKPQKNVNDKKKSIKMIKRKSNKVWKPIRASSKNSHGISFPISNKPIADMREDSDGSKSIERPIEIVEKNEDLRTREIIRDSIFSINSVSSRDIRNDHHKSISSKSDEEVPLIKLISPNDNKDNLERDILLDEIEELFDKNHSWSSHSNSLSSKSQSSKLAKKISLKKRRSNRNKKNFTQKKSILRTQKTKKFKKSKMLKTNTIIELLSKPAIEQNPISLKRITLDYYGIQKHTFGKSLLGEKLKGISEEVSKESSIDETDEIQNNESSRFSKATLPSHLTTLQYPRTVGSPPIRSHLLQSRIPGAPKEPKISSPLPSIPVATKPSQINQQQHTQNKFCKFKNSRGSIISSNSNESPDTSQFTKYTPILSPTSLISLNPVLSTKSISRLSKVSNVAKKQSSNNLIKTGQIADTSKSTKKEDDKAKDKMTESRVRIMKQELDQTSPVRMDDRVRHKGKGFDIAKCRIGRSKETYIRSIKDKVLAFKDQNSMQETIKNKKDFLEKFIVEKEIHKQSSFVRKAYKRNTPKILFPRKSKGPKKNRFLSPKVWNDWLIDQNCQRNQVQSVQLSPKELLSLDELSCSHEEAIMKNIISHQKDGIKKRSIFTPPNVRLYSPKVSINSVFSNPNSGSFFSPKNSMKLFKFSKSKTNKRCPQRAFSASKHSVNPGSVCLTQNSILFL